MVMWTCSMNAPSPPVGGQRSRSRAPLGYSCLPTFPPAGFPSSLSADVDECRGSPHPCANGHCQNSPGGFSCRCHTGFQADPSGMECQGMGSRGFGPQGNRPSCAPVSLIAWFPFQILMNVPTCPDPVQVGIASTLWARSAAPVPAAISPIPLAPNVEVMGVGPWWGWEAGQPIAPALLCLPHFSTSTQR